MRLHGICLVLASAIICAAQSTPAPTPPTPEALASAYTQAMQARDWPHALAAAQQLVETRPSAENLRLLANAQLYSGAWQDAIATSDRALAQAQAEKPAEGQPQNAWKEQIAGIYISKGNACLKLRQNDKALEAYNEGAKFAANPGLAYFNICATQYNLGNTDPALAACRKCLEADPGKADAWFILGSLLYVDAHTDAKGKFVISTEARQALEKYLELAPTGPHVADVKAMLDMATK